jgi:hypothetical protein
MTKFLKHQKNGDCGSLAVWKNEGNEPLANVSSGVSVSCKNELIIAFGDKVYKKLVDL